MVEAILVEKCRLEVWCQQFSLQTPAIKWPSPSGREDMDVREAADGADVNFNKKNFNFTYNTNITDMLQTWQNLLESDKKC